MNRERPDEKFGISDEDVDLPRRSLSERIGQIGEDYVKEILGEIALVNALARDKGLDLHCLLTHGQKVMPYSFFIQVKTRQDFRSLTKPIYIRRSTINLWCLVKAPVYLILVSLKPEKKAFWINAIESLSRNFDFLDKTCSYVKLNPKLDNPLTPNSFSHFQNDIIRTNELLEKILQSVAVLERSKNGKTLQKTKVQKEFYDLHDALTRYHLGMSVKSKSQALRTYFSLWERLESQRSNRGNPVKLMRVAMSTTDIFAVTDAIRCLFYMESPTVYQFSRELSILKQKLTYNKRLRCLRDALLSIYHKPRVADPPSWSRIVGESHLPAIVLLLFKSHEVIRALESLKGAALVESKGKTISLCYFDLPSSLHDTIRCLTRKDVPDRIIQRAARRSMERSFISGYKRDPNFAAHLIGWYALYWGESIKDLTEKGRELVLRALTHHPDPRVRLDCAVLIGKERPDTAIPVLEELCQVPSLARVAKKALDNIRVCH